MEGTPVELQKLYAVVLQKGSAEAQVVFPPPLVQPVDEPAWAQIWKGPVPPPPYFHTRI
jgi:hypothetical protein